MMTTALSGLVLGLLSSFHCVGMCGPLLLALPSRQLAAPGRFLAPFLYHGGRILVYVTGGVLFGSLGRHIYLAGWQQLFSITMGVLILGLYAARRLSLMPAMRISSLLGRRVARLWQVPSTATFFLMGMANGLLPCGMVYLAIAAALTRGSVGGATVFMLSFGLGTLPLLAGVQYAGRLFAPALRSRLRRTLPLVTVAMAILLILRGLNLGIPFISPRLASAPQQVVSCH